MGDRRERDGVGGPTPCREDDGGGPKDAHAGVKKCTVEVELNTDTEYSYSLTSKQCGVQCRR